jgi:hypothetical protein
MNCNLPPPRSGMSLAPSIAMAGQLDDHEEMRRLLFRIRDMVRESKDGKITISTAPHGLRDQIESVCSRLSIRR